MTQRIKEVHEADVQEEIKDPDERREKKKRIFLLRGELQTFIQTPRTDQFGPVLHHFFDQVSETNGGTVRL